MSNDEFVSTDDVSVADVGFWVVVAVKVELDIDFKLEDSTTEADDTDATAGLARWVLSSGMFFTSLLGAGFDVSTSISQIS